MAFALRYANHSQGNSYAPSLVRDVIASDYRSQYERAVKNFAPQHSRGGHRPPPSRQAYNVKRTEQLRADWGKETAKHMSEALDLKETEDTLNQIEANKILTAATLLVTTTFCNKLPNNTNR
jgi:hypothetical protein